MKYFLFYVLIRREITYTIHLGCKLYFQNINLLIQGFKEGVIKHSTIYLHSWFYFLHCIVFVCQLMSKSFKILIFVIDLYTVFIKMYIYAFVILNLKNMRKNRRIPHSKSKNYKNVYKLKKQEKEIKNDHKTWPKKKRRKCHEYISKKSLEYKFSKVCKIST